MDAISPRRYLDNHHHHNHQTLLLPSPHHNIHSSNSSSSNSCTTNSNGLHHTQQLPPLTPTPLTPMAPTSTPTPTPTPYPPKPITRSESTTPYPTTFVQADSSSFKQVVQMLTGSSETAKQASSTYSSISKPTFLDTPSLSNSKTHMIPPIKTIPTKQQHNSGFKLYERRNNLNKNLNINPLLPVFSSNPSPTGFSPRKHAEVLSPSILDFPALVLSPVTPLLPDPFDRSGSSATGYRSADTSGNGSPTLNTEAEEKAIKEKGFFLHPSPATTPRDPEPRLLPLFPTTSPRASGSSSS